MDLMKMSLVASTAVVAGSVGYILGVSKKKCHHPENIIEQASEMIDITSDFLGWVKQEGPEMDLREFAERIAFLSLAVRVVDS